MKHLFTLSLWLLLAGCSGYKSPSMSGDPAKMSAETLCFRYTSSKDPQLAAEIDACGLDCSKLLEDDPLYSGPDESAYRLGR